MSCPSFHLSPSRPRWFWWMEANAVHVAAMLTHLVSVGGRLETGAIRVFHRRQEWLQLMRILIFFSFWLNNLYTEIKTGSNCRVPGHSFTCHWIRIASLILCLDLQSLPIHVSEADQSGRILCSLAKLKERFIRFFLCWSLQCLRMKPSSITTGPCSS